MFPGDGGPLPPPAGGPEVGATRLSPVAALREATLPALARPPCVISFSGGRDSSIILAAALTAAREHGLCDPIPVTLRFAGAALAEESEWQEKVVAHLHLDNWERIVVEEDFGMAGPLATATLRRYGLMNPANGFAYVPVLDLARGGSLLTGLGGDDLFVPWRWQSLADSLARRSRPNAWDVIDLVSLALPRSARREIEGVRKDLAPPHWLTPHGAELVRAEVLDEAVTEPLSWPPWLFWRIRRRVRATSVWSLERLAEPTNTLVCHPLMGGGFLSALGRFGGRLGLGDRTAAMRALFADLLPDEILARQTKAIFDEVYWSEPTRAFVAAWDGTGVDEALVDSEALRREWSGSSPSFQSALLLQQAFLGGLDC